MDEAPLPPGIERGGLVGPSLTTLIASLKGACHASFSTVRKFLRDVVRVTISRGEPARIIAKVSRALERPHQELLDDLPGQARLNVDETGHKPNGDRQWTWCFRAALSTLFKIDPTRSGDVLVEVLGKEFDGVPGCDYFSAYRRYQRKFGVLLQFCLAHLVRDVKFLTTLPDARDRAYGERLREALRRLFAVIHRREGLSAEVFLVPLEAARAEVLRCGARDVPETRASGNLAKRFELHGASYFRFITSPGVEPTNNLAEQAIRFVVLDRVVTQGTRSEAGNRWCERIWTVIATCTQQGRSVFAYLEAAVAAWFDGAEAPSLLPGGHWSLQEFANVLRKPACSTPKPARAFAPRRLRHSHQGVREDRIVRRAGPGGDRRGAEAGFLRPETVAVLHRPAGRGVGLDRTAARGRKAGGDPPAGCPPRRPRLVDAQLR
jgi:transposase